MLAGLFEMLLCLLQPTGTSTSEEGEVMQERNDQTEPDEYYGEEEDIDYDGEKQLSHHPNRQSMHSQALLNEFQNILHFLWGQRGSHEY